MTDPRDEYLARKKATTKEEWEAQVAKWENLVNIESLILEGMRKGWMPK